MQAMKSQELLPKKAIEDDPVYCITQYISHCAWEEGIRISEPMVRATTFFTYAECLRNHNVPLFDVQTYPFDKGPFGPLVAKQYAYTGVWNPGRWINALSDSDRLVICDEEAQDFRFLDYKMVEKYFDANYPYLRDIVVRIFRNLDEMSDFEVSEILMNVSKRLGYKGDVSLQEFQNFPLFEDFVNTVPVKVAMEMISADEARKLAKPDIEAHVVYLNSRITEAAKQGKTEVIVRKAPYRCWLYIMDDDQKPEAEAVLKLLKDKGFQCKLFYNEAQFVDIGLRIIWE